MLHEWQIELLEKITSRRLAVGDLLDEIQGHADADADAEDLRNARHLLRAGFNAAERAVVKPDGF